VAGARYKDKLTSLQDASRKRWALCAAAPECCPITKIAPATPKSPS